MADIDKKDHKKESAEENSSPPLQPAPVPARRATPSPADATDSAPPGDTRPHPQSEANDAGRQQRQRKTLKLPSVDELIAQLLHLNGAVLMGQISTQQANLMYRTITSAITALMKRGSGTQDQLKDTESLVEAIRRDPSLLNTLEAFLSDDQLDRLLKELNGHDDQQRPPAA